MSGLDPDLRAIILRLWLRQKTPTMNCIEEIKTRIKRDLGINLIRNNATIKTNDTVGLISVDISKLSFLDDFEEGTFLQKLSFSNLLGNCCKFYVT